MKTISFTSLAIACSMTALAIGCAKGKNNNPEAAAAAQPDYKYQYNIQDATCAAKETGAHIATSPDEACKLLLDDKANNNCAKNERNERFQSLCTDEKEEKDPKKEDDKTDVTGDTSKGENAADGTASTATTNSTTTTLSKIDAGADETAFDEAKEEAKTEKKEDLSGLLRLRPMSDTDNQEDTIKVIPNKKEGDLLSISRETSISCVKGVAAALKLKSNGVILFGKSKLVFNQDENPLNLKDVEISTRLATLVTCLGNSSIKEEDLLKVKIADSETYETRNLKLGESITETMMTLPEGEAPRSTEVLVSCVKDHAASALSGKNGLQLLAGATLLLNRDQGLSSLKKLNHDKESVVVTCGLQSN